MFCYQCSETSKGIGCEAIGVCGKKPEVAELQDLLIWVTKGISYWSIKAKELGIKDPEANLFVAEALFTTITNVNFSSERISNMIDKALLYRDRIKESYLKEYEGRYKKTFEEKVPEAAVWKGNRESYLDKAREVGVLSEKDEDIRSLKEFLIYGLKGIAAYTDHAYILKHTKDDILYFIQNALAETLRNDITADELEKLILEAGKYAVEAMALLDKANTSTYGHPEITEVYTGTYNAPAILVSGHDLLDLEELLKQTEGTGINIYTHGEMLPAHAYPELKKYKHLVGNYGSAWWKQTKEFEEFGGAILMTTNCLVPPKESYKDRVFTTGLVGFDGVTHIPNRIDGKPKDFSPVIKKALELGPIPEREGKKLVIGFAHNQLEKLLDVVLKKVEEGKITKFFVMAGCDGRLKAREYYTEFARKLPQNTVILTAGCAKYRYNYLDLGDIDGIPRIIDAGQCNDSYSLALIALKLKEILGVDDINDLPIEYNIAWYEQKAVAVLLALLYLGVRKIKLGPVLPAFLSPNVLKVVAEKFNISTISTVEEDLKQMLA